jgi:hypothetical protein
MRILHALPSLSGGGAERQMSYLASAQARAGHEVGVAYRSEGPEPPELPGVVRHALRASGNHDPRLLVRLVALLRRVRPEIAHTWILQMDVLAGLAARLTGTPWVCREPVSGATYGGAWKHRLRRGLLRGADAIVANSTAGERYWAGLHPGGTRCVIGNALPLDAIEAAPPTPPEALGVAPGRRFARPRGAPHRRARVWRGNVPRPRRGAREERRPRRARPPAGLRPRRVVGDEVRGRIRVRQLR